MESKFEFLEKHYQQMFDHVAVGMHFCNGDGIIERANDFLAHMLGYEKDMLTGMSVSQITVPEDYQTLLNKLASFVGREQDHFVMEKRYIHKDGTHIWAETSVSAIYDEEGHPYQFFAIIKNIHESKQMKKIMSDQRLLLSTAMDKIPNRVFMKNAHGRYLACNSVFAKDVKMTPQEIIGKVDLDIYDERLAKKYRRDDMRIIAEGRPADIIEEYITGDTTRWVLTSKAPVYSDSEVIGIIGSFIDITNRMHMDKNIRENMALQQMEVERANEMFQLIFDVSEDLICMLNRDGIILQTNPSWFRQLGYTQSMLIGKSMARFLKQEDMAKAVAFFKEIYENGNSRPYKSDIPLIAGNSKEIWYNWSIRLVDDVIVASGRNIMIQRETEAYLINSRISAEKARLASERARIAAENARKASEKANKVKDEFIANMSHEIRTPLNAIIGLADLLSMQLNDRKQLKSVNTIKVAGNALLGLMNDILDLSKIEAGMMSVVHDVVSINDVVVDLSQIFEREVMKKRLSLRVIPDETMPDALMMDMKRTRQILLNIVGNAVKFTDEGGIVVRTKYLGRNNDETVNISISVKDTGIGIPEKDQERIFQSFQQQSANINHRYGGTGLGLAISRRLAELMGGSLALASKVGVGSDVILTLRGIELSHITEVEEVSNGILDICFPHTSILVVDDEALNLELMEEILKDRCRQLDCASDGQEALTLIEKNDYDLIIMDMIMPGVSGLQVARQIRKLPDYYDVPIICFTATVVENVVGGDHDSVFSDYLTKPIHISDMMTCINQWVNKQKSHLSG